MERGRQKLCESADLLVRAEHVPEETPARRARVIGDCGKIVEHAYAAPGLGPRAVKQALALLTGGSMIGTTLRQRAPEGARQFERTLHGALERLPIQFKSRHSNILRVRQAPRSGPSLSLD